MPLAWPSSYEVNLNEVCHWFMIQRKLVSFNITNEILFTTTLPTDISIEKTDQSLDMIHTFVLKYLMVLNESVAYLANHHDMTTYFHIWIFGRTWCQGIMN